MTSSRHRSSSARSNSSNVEGRQPSPAGSNRSFHRHQGSSDLVLSDIPFGASLQIPNSAGGSPYPGIASSPSRSRAVSDLTSPLPTSYRPAQFQQGQRLASASAAMDSRNQYLPGPPPIISPPQQQQSGLPIPPPPPRPHPQQQQQQQMSSHGAVPPPPPGPFPGPPPQLSQGLTAGWVGQGWNRFVPPPPPPPMQPPSATTPYSQSTGYQPPPPPPLNLNIPPPQTERHPLTSATYIPGSGSFGPGVGIPGYHSDYYDNNNDADIDAAALAAASAASSGERTHSRDNARLANEAFPQASGDGDLPTYNPYPTVHESTTPSRRELSIRSNNARDWHSPGPPTSMKTSGLEAGMGMGHKFSVSAHSNSSDYVDPASQWTLDRVLVWLGANDFSADWREVFKELNIHGLAFLELGSANGGRGNFGMMHNQVYPALAKQCTKSGTGWDQGREREEGKRMRRLIRRVAEGILAEQERSGHARKSSTQLLPGDSGMESSPNLTTPSTAGPGEESPGTTNYFRNPLQTHRSFRNGLYNNNQATNSEPNVADRNPQTTAYASTRQGATRELLSNINGGGNKRHSPSSSGAHENSQGGSPAQQYASLSKDQQTSGTSAPATGRFEHHKTNSTDSVTSNHRGFLNGEGRRNGREGSRPPPLDSTARTQSDGPPSAEAKHRGFFDRIRHRKKDHGQHDDQNPDSPTSPAFGHKYPTPTLTSAKPVSASADSFLERPSSTSTMSEQEKRKGRGAARLQSGPRKYIFITADRVNYRLLDVTDYDSPDLLREHICHALNVADSDTAQIYLTEAGQLDHDEALTDSMLQLCKRTKADGKGTLKFLVRNGSAPVSASSGGIGIPGLNLFDESPTAATFNLKPGQPSPGLPMESPLRDQIDPDLDAAAAEYQRKVAQQQKAYLDGRKEKLARDSPTDPNFRGIRREGGVIDFDQRRDSPYERPESLVPMRKPPPAPAESSTLIKANSLKKSPEKEKDSKRKSGSEPHELLQERGRRKAVTGSSSFSTNIGNALLAAGQLGSGVGTPAMSPDLVNTDFAVDPNGRPQRALQSVDFGSRNNSPGGSPRSPGFTRGKNDMLFRIPAYDENAQSPHPDGLGLSVNSLQHPQHPSIEQLRRPSPNISPGTDPSPPRRESVKSRRSFGPAFTVTENEVSFVKTPVVQQKDSDSDSDDGLFARPLANNKGGGSKRDSKKPALNLDTRAEKTKSVAFASTPDRANQSDSTNPESAISAISPDANTKLNRRKSLLARDDVWANRPPMEALINDLDVYFPNVDLDQPVLEEVESPPHSPSHPGTQKDQIPDMPKHRPLPPEEVLVSHIARPLSIADQAIPEETDTMDTLGSDESTLKTLASAKSVAQRRLQDRNSGLGRMKSIREVARGASQSINRRAPRSLPSQKIPAAELARRRSTKMFGANIVQINPGRGSRMSLVEAVANQPPPSSKRQNTYRVIRGQLIGKGTYGRVYIGMNTTTGEFLAIKQVEVNTKAAGQDKEKVKDLVAALDREIDTMQHLEHPNIVQYLGCERKDTSVSIFLEYISGGSIGSCLRKLGKFEERVVRSLTRQVLSGLSYLHSQGILHRDLKADNILLDTDGTCKISDFGISKRSDNIYGNDASNSMQGSVFWMAPEVVRSQGQGYSAKVDIWSLGCVVLEMFAGRRPWAKEEAIGAIYKLGSLNQAPPIPDDVSEVVSAEAVAFMWDCFTVDPGDRPTAKTLLDWHAFCRVDEYYNFLDTELHRKIENIAEFKGQVGR